MKIQSKLLGSVLLISGTAIGAGMLALPVETGPAGFLPTCLLFFIYWCYMTYTALLMLEVDLWMEEEGANLISMAKHTIGKPGELIGWTAYLLLLYLLTTAYLAVGGPILVDFFQSLTGFSFPAWSGTVPLLVVFGFFVYEGTKSVDYLNRLLMFGLAITYGLMMIFLMPHVKLSLLSHVHWKSTLFSLSLVATSFGYHIIIPTLTTYLERNTSLLVKAILLGSLVPLTVYLLWEVITLGIIPLAGRWGLLQGYHDGENAVRLLSNNIGQARVTLVAQFFSFFAIVTSFLGVTLSLSDFLADGLRIKKSHGGRALILVLTFLPPLIFIISYPRAFLSALEFAGAYGVIVLLGILPPAMVWSGRYIKGFKAPFKVPGGKPALIIVILFSLLVISMEVMGKMGWIN